MQVSDKGFVMSTFTFLIKMAIGIYTHLHLLSERPIYVYKEVFMTFEVRN